MHFGTLRHHRDDASRAKFHTLLNGPLHAIELEDCKEESQGGDSGGWNDFAQFEFDPAIGDADDAAATDIFSSRDIKFLPNPGAKHIREVVGMGTNQCGAIAEDFIGDPAAAGHGCENVMLNTLR